MFALGCHHVINIACDSCESSCPFFSAETRETSQANRRVTSTMGEDREPPGTGVPSCWVMWELPVGAPQQSGKKTYQTTTKILQIPAE